MKSNLHILHLKQGKQDTASFLGLVKYLTNTSLTVFDRWKIYHSLYNNIQCQMSFVITKTHCKSVNEMAEADATAISHKCPNHATLIYKCFCHILNNIPKVH